MLTQVLIVKPYQKSVSKNKSSLIFKNNPRNNPQEDYQYFDEELYKRRTVIERANAWLDSFKALLIRFETLVTTWVAFHLIAFAVIFIRKINKAPKV